jgi:3-mercaptopyruvate sulfurtransferase SseA
VSCWSIDPATPAVAGRFLDRRRGGLAAEHREEAGITPDKRVAFYCGTGWRAAETWFYALLMDRPRISVYDGGWFEWSQDPLNNPIETGELEDQAAA